MSKAISVALMLLFAHPCSGGNFAVFSDLFPANTLQEAIDIGSGFYGQEAWQLTGANGKGTILYSEEFPISDWGKGKTFDTPWENQNGLMQTILRRDFPEDWSDLTPNVLGAYHRLNHWHILTG